MNAPPQARTAAYTGVRRDVLDLIALDRRRVLDVGCANGSLGRALKQRQATAVVGIENHPAYASQARDHLDHVLELDLNDVAAVRSALHSQAFDCAVLADVLEHLQDPWALLSVVSESLSPGGHAVISVPNVGHIDTLWNVFVRGTWPRRERGLHDGTHVQWFAERDLPELLRAGGLTLVQARRNYRFVDRPTARNEMAARLAMPGLRRLLTYQFVMLAYKSDNSL